MHLAVLCQASLLIAIHRLPALLIIRRRAIITREVMPVASDEHMTLAEAAKYLGISKAKLSRMAKTEELKYVSSPLDRRFKLFRKTDLDAMKALPRPSGMKAAV